MEKREETNNFDEERRNQLGSELAWSCIHSYLKEIAYLSSDEFRYYAEILKYRILDAEKKNAPPEPLLPKPQARIVAICDQNGIPLSGRGSLETANGHIAGEEIPEEEQKVSSTVKAEVISGSKKASKRRKSKPKHVETKPVVFLEDDAVGEYISD